MPETNHERKKYVDELLDEHKQLLTYQQPYISLWKEVRDFILPMSGKFYSEGDDPNDPIANRYKKIIDDTPTRANSMTAAGMQSGLSNQTQMWFKNTLPDKQLANYKPVKMWLEGVDQVTRFIFNNTSFYPSVHKGYEEQVGFGQCATYSEDSEKKHARYLTLTAGEYALGKNADDEYDMLFREFGMTYRNIKKFFGVSLDKLNFTKESFKDVKHKFQKVVHAVFPNTKGNLTKYSAKAMPYTSAYVLKPQELLLRVRGYRSFPYAIGVWNANGEEPYGRAFGHYALGNSKMLQNLHASKLKGVHKVNDPPVQSGPGLKGRVRHLPASTTFTSGRANDTLGPLYQIKPDIPAISEVIVDTRTQIEKTYRNDVFLFIASNPYATAREVAERHDEKIFTLGPMIERQFTGYLRPLIQRTIELAWWRNMIPPPPEPLLSMMLQGQISTLEIEYTSLLAQALKMIGARTIDATIDFAVRNAQVLPDMINTINQEEAIRMYAEMHGSPARLLHSRDEMNQKREMEAAAMEAQNQRADLQQAADIENLEADTALKEERARATG